MRRIRTFLTNVQGGLTVNKEETEHDFIRMWIVNLVILVAVAGCAVPQAGIIMPDGSTMYKIYSRVEFVDDQDRSVQVDYFPEDIRLLFGLIPGSIYGMPESKPYLYVGVTSNYEYRLNLGFMTERVQKAATALKKNEYTEGLTMMPASTRLLRIATLAEDVKTGKYFGGTGFRDGVLRDILILVYVDRPCSITGTLNSDGESSEIVEHNIHLGHSGFHWLRLHELWKGRSSLKEHSPSGDVYFAIQKK